METFNTEQAKAAQMRLCKKNNWPHFAPYSGMCYECKRDIYQAGEHNTIGVSVESATAGIITGCPHCGHSFCD